MSRPSPTPRRIKPVLLYSFGALGGVLFGYDLGVIAGILVVVAKSWQLSGFQQGVLTASLSAGAMLGAGLAARLNGRIGRRRTIMAAGGVVIAGTLACALAPDFGALVGFRTVLGLGVGLSSATVPTYLSELAPAPIRGAMGSLNQIFIVGGILIAFLVDYWLQPRHLWRWMFAGALVPAVILVAGLAFLPETPRWLVNLGRENEARAVLAATHPAGEIEAELAAIRAVIRLDAAQTAYRVRELWAPWVRPMLLMALLLAVGQQFGGVNALTSSLS
ncbi:MFS transporter [Kitasatospora sp. NPDC057904]|uniref:MFS transporter n=1 Tax=unclassified Kitasatospora TaxID=2633591 RepID=UPI0036DCBFF6